MHLTAPRARAASCLLTAAVALGMSVSAGAPAGAVGPVQRTAVIVQLQPGTDAAAAARQAAGGNGQVNHVYTDAVVGFAATLPALAVDALRRNPRVISVEPDAAVQVYGTQAPTPSWGLDRVDQAQRPLNGSYTWAGDGKGVSAYVVDTGIRADHADFTGRVRSGFTAVADGRGTGDCNGHGTHVAGTIGGAGYGVAKAVTPVSVRVLGCDGSGSYSQVIAGLDWIVKDHLAGAPAVANISLGGPASSTVDAAVKAVISDGVSVAVAAGNSNVDACRTSPARVPAAITVGATTNVDARASYSNYGSCLDLFAPGSSIVSAWPTSTTASATLSGTSMASPHAAGAAAALLSREPGLTPAAVADRLVKSATPNVVSSSGANSPTRLLRTGA